MRTGVFGGSFDPVHFGHLLVAEDAMSVLGLDRVLFVPCPVPPHKPKPKASFKDRAAMTKRALRGRKGLELSPIESRRPGPHYTADTLAELRREFPKDSFYLLVGNDQYQDMARWHEPKRLTRLARIAVISRPGSEKPRRFPAHPRLRVRFVEVIPVDISSRLIRARLAKGRSVEYMLPSSVLTYIKQRRLYR